VFCPNCGTQNPDAAQTCSKCSFHLKSAAAPKFKGTMLMVNQPGAPLGGPLVPPPGRPGAPGAAPPPGAGSVPSRLKGTMVGVAPMAGGLPFPPPPGNAPAPPPPPFGLPPSPGAPMGEAASAFSPPVPQPGVNPLGGTLAADAGIMGAFAAHQQAAGAGAAPPQGLPPGLPMGVPPPPGGPAAGNPTYPFGAPPPGAPQPPPGFVPFAVPPPPGAPSYGGPQNALSGPYQAAGPMVGTLKSLEAKQVAPTRRNALLTLLLPAAVVFGGVFLSVLLAFVISPALGSLASLFALGGGVWYLLLAVQMVSELKSVTRSGELAWWPLIVPIYQLYFMWVVVPQEVAKGKQLVGARQPPQNILLYIFVWHYALASDLNDLVR